MPNHVENKLSVIGPVDDVGLYLSMSQTPTPKTGDKPEYNANGRQVNCNYDDEPLPDRVTFNFHGVVPLPEMFRQVPYSVHEGIGGYEMQVETWSVKWGPYRVQPIRIEPGKATIHFTTAWGPPRKYYVKASKAFPSCVFIVSYGGEGPCFGRIIYQDGQEAQIVDGNWRDVPPSDEENDDYSAADAFVMQYMNTHDDFVDEYCKIN